MEMNIRDLCETLISEKKAQEKMSDFPRLIRYNNLKSIHFSTESFFRLILRASAKVGLCKYWDFLKIKIFFRQNSSSSQYYYSPEPWTMYVWSC